MLRRPALANGRVLAAELERYPINRNAPKPS
jgi:hypothetical protein